MTEPYFVAKPGDTVQSKQWNEIQVRLRDEIQSHTHSGGEQGTRLTGDAIDSNAALSVRHLAAAASLTVGSPPQFAVTPAGNVGIGTTDPGPDRLRVVGTLRSDLLRVTGSAELGGDLRAAAITAAGVLSARGGLAIGTLVGDAPPVITARTVPVDQDGAGERTEMILFHGNDGTNAAGPDTITLRAPAIRLQTFSDPTVSDIADAKGSLDRLVIGPTGDIQASGSLTVAGALRVDTLTANAATLTAAKVKTLAVDALTTSGALRVAGPATLDRGLTVRVAGSAGWDRLVVTATQQWGGAAAYVTLGAGDAAGIMFHNPHVVWHAGEKRASIRYAPADADGAKPWWDVGARDDDAFTVAVNNSAHALRVEASGNVGVGVKPEPGNRLQIGGDLRAEAITAAGVLNARGGLAIGTLVGDAPPVITARTVPPDQGGSNERTELILFHGNDGANGAGPDSITLRAPTIRLQTFNDASVTDIADAKGSIDRLVVGPTGDIKAQGPLTVSGGLKVDTLTASGATSLDGGLTVRVAGVGGWDRLSVTTTQQWSAGTPFVTIGAGDALGIMFHNPHVVWHPGEERASIRYAPAGADGSKPWWDVGARSDGAFTVAVNNSPHVLRVEATGNVGIGVKPEPGNRLQISGGHLHLDGGSIFLRKGPTDQRDVLRWNPATDRVDLGGWNGVSLGTTSGAGANAVTPVAEVTSAGLRVTGTITGTVNARPLTEQMVHRRIIFGLAGDKPLNFDSGEGATIRYFYGPFSYGCPPVQPGATRKFRVYAVYSDNMSDHEIQVLFRLSSEWETDNASVGIFTFTLGCTVGSPAHNRDAYSPWLVGQPPGNHGFVRIRTTAPGTLGTLYYLELQAWDVF